MITLYYFISQDNTRVGWLITGMVKDYYDMVRFIEDMSEDEREAFDKHFQF